MKRRSKILIGVVMALGIGWPLRLMISHKNVRDKVAAYKQELRAKGEKLTFAELAPPPSTKTPNGAMALTNAIKYSFEPWAFPQVMTMISPGVARIGHTNIGAESMSGYATNVQRTAELRNILSKAAVLDFHPDYSDPNCRGLLPHCALLTQAEQLTAQTALQALYKRDYSEAWLDLCAAADLVRLFDNEPLEYSQLMRFVMMQFAIAPTWEALQENEWTDAQLSELQSKWEATDLLSMMEPLMAMERADEIQQLATLRSPSGRVFGLAMFLGGGTSNATGGWMNTAWLKAKDLYDRYPRTWGWKSSGSYEEELCHIKIGTAAVDTSRSIKATGAFVPALTEFRRQVADIHKLHPDADIRFVPRPGSKSVYDEFFTAFAAHETEKRLLITAIALKRFHLQHGDYPANLTELVPNYLKQSPMDFMDGKPLRYRLRSDGDFLLYSVGEDGVDNGGDASPLANGELGIWPVDDVWPRAATAAEVEQYEGHSGNKTNAPGK